MNSALQTTPGFTIHIGGTYVHDSGSKGTYSYVAPESLLTFQGGTLDKPAARVEVNDKLGIIPLYNERRSGTRGGSRYTAEKLRSASTSLAYNSSRLNKSAGVPIS